MGALVNKTVLRIGKPLEGELIKVLITRKKTYMVKYRHAKSPAVFSPNFIEQKL